MCLLFLVFCFFYSTFCSFSRSHSQFTACIIFLQYIFLFLVLLLLLALPYSAKIYNIQWQYKDTIARNSCIFDSLFCYCIKRFLNLFRSLAHLLWSQKNRTVYRPCFHENLTNAKHKPKRLHSTFV